MEVKKVKAAPNKPVKNGKFIFGVYNTPYKEINMMDAKKVWKFPIPKFLQKLRLAEWQAFQLWDGKYLIMCVVGVSHIAKNVMAEIYVYDNELDKIIYKDFTITKKSYLSKDDGLIDSVVRLKTDRLEYKISNDLGDSDTISLNVKYNDFELQFTGEHGSATPLCYCMPFAKNRGLYSHKTYIKGNGYMVVGEQKIDFTDNARMNVDDHKGYYPFKNTYDWMTASTIFNDKHVGITVTKNQILNPAVNNENIIWINGEINYLPKVTFTREKDVSKEWRIKDDNGIVDLTFVPTKNDIGFFIRKLFGLILLNYYTPIGHLSGTVKIDDEAIEFNSALGIGERRIGRI
ncbi:DUF2804 family protein [Mycoplasmatota bacterium WC44]